MFNLLLEFHAYISLNGFCDCSCPDLSDSVASLCDWRALSRYFLCPCSISLHSLRVAFRARSSLGAVRVFILTAPISLSIAEYLLFRASHAACDPVVLFLLALRRWCPPPAAKRGCVSRATSQPWLCFAMSRRLSSWPCAKPFRAVHTLQLSRPAALTSIVLWAANSLNRDFLPNRSSYRLV